MHSERRLNPREMLKSVFWLSKSELNPSALSDRTLGVAAILTLTVHMHSTYLPSIDGVLSYHKENGIHLSKMKAY